MYRKFTANHIFTGTAMLPAGHVIITTSEGVITEITEQKDAGDNIETLNGLLCPGFINTHCHLELSHLKDLVPAHSGLVDFVFAIIGQRNADEAVIAEAIKNAEDEMLQNGIVAVGDICNTTHTLLQKKKARLWYHNFIEVTGFVPATAEKRFEAASETLLQFKKQSAGSGQHSTINPHAPYSVSPRLFELINTSPGNSLLTLHSQEAREEQAFFETGTGDFIRLYKQLGIDISFFHPSGKSSLQTVLPYLNKQQSLLLVHNVTLSEEDIKTVQLAEASQQLAAVYYCLCPNANRYITNQLPDINTLVKNNCAVVLGTDSLASNHQLSIIEEMKTIQQHFPALPLQLLLQWATFNGARALGMDAVLGSFEKGKKPGLVLIEGADDLQLGTAAAARRIL